MILFNVKLMSEIKLCERFDGLYENPRNMGYKVW